MEQAGSRIWNKLHHLTVSKFIHWQSHITRRHCNVLKKGRKIPWIENVSCKMHHEDNCCSSLRLYMRWLDPWDKGIELCVLKNLFFPQFFFSLKKQTYRQLEVKGWNSEILVARDHSKNGQQPHLLKRVSIYFRKLCKQSMSKNI